MDANPPPPEPTPEPLGSLPMRCSPSIDKLTLSLAKAQGQFSAIDKAKSAKIQTKSGTSFQYSYADLASILTAIRRPLSENTLAVMQPIRVNGRTVSVTTIVAHGSGQWIADELDMPIGDPSDARSVASAATYARRYGLIALLGIAPADEDDDADAATIRPAPSRPPVPATTAPPPASETAPTPTDELISEGQRRRLFAIGKEHGWSSAALKVWLAARDITSTNDIPRTKYDALIDELLASDREPASEVPNQDHPF